MIPISTAYHGNSQKATYNKKRMLSVQQWWTSIIKCYPHMLSSFFACLCPMIPLKENGLSIAGFEKGPG
jgi:hypothetical protein